MRKKLLSLMLAFMLAFSMVGLIGCGGDGYTEVYSVEYGANDSKKILLSYAKIIYDYDSEVEIMQEDFWDFNDDYKFSYPPFTSSTIIYKNKSNIEILAYLKAGDFIVCNSGENVYYKIQIKEIIISYVNVKIIDNRTIAFDYVNISGNHIKEMVSVDYFTITYFV